MFKIHFPQSAAHSEKVNMIARGEIVLGGFRENFESCLSFWNRDRYEQQWREGVTHFVMSGTNSCLITSINDPTTSTFFVWWLLYPEGQDCVLQNHLLFLDQLPAPFEISKAYEFVPARQSMSEEGEPISEWRVSKLSLENWMTR